MGKITKERVWWDLMKYEISLSVEAEQRSLSGTNRITFKALDKGQILQIDLQEPMMIQEVRQQDRPLSYRKKGETYLVHLQKPLEKGMSSYVDIDFKGSPPTSDTPPWDGGWVWKRDNNGKHFISHANQLIGPSSWFPCKDHPYDEPDHGMEIKIKAPPGLTAVSNGRLEGSSKDESGRVTFHWKVNNPINAYGINVNIGDYVHFGEKYNGEKGELSCDYYVLKDNMPKASVQFKQAPMTLEAMEYWFGPYPFYEDGYKLVEVPYLGMEHQSSVTYGNEFENGYLGNDLSHTGWGLKFDFIIIHESAHEWFANSITNNDVADMWIHESFTTYAEVLYLDYYFGKEAGNEYLVGYRQMVRNDKPLIGKHGKNDRGSNDMYIKGAAMIHTLRQVIDDDAKFRELLRSMNREFYHQTISSAEMERFIIEETGLELKAFFDQYLRTTNIPAIHYQVNNGVLRYRFKNTVQDFRIPVRFFIGDLELWLDPMNDWQSFDLPSPDAAVSIDPNFFIDLVEK